MADIEFKSEFVKMTRNPSHFAKNLEVRLNELTEEGWVIRIEYDTKRGALLIASRQKNRFDTSGLRAVSLKDLINGFRAPSHAEQFLRELEPLHGDGELAEVAPKIPKAVEECCKGAPVQKLSDLYNDLQKFADDHKKVHPSGDGQTCSFDRYISLVIAEVSKYIQKSVS